MIKRKVGTITLAVALISAGVVLFARNFINITIKDFFSYWPVLLIGLGLEMIIFMITHTNKEEKVRMSVDGLCVALIIIFAVFSTGTRIVGGDFPLNFHINGETIVDSGRYKAELKETYSKDGISAGRSVNKVLVDNIMGDVKIKDSDSDSIKIEANIKVRFNDEAKAREYAKKAIVIKEDTTTEISTLAVDNGFKDDYSAAIIDYTIYVPKNADIEIIERFGDVETDGFTGNIKIDNKYGSTTLKKVDGSVTIDSAFGSIELSSIVGKTYAKTNNGKIEAQNIDGDTELETAFGAIEAEKINGSLKAVSKNGKVDVEDINGKTVLESYFGSVKVDGVKGETNAQSKNGSIDAVNIDGNAYLETAFGSIKYESDNIKNSTVYAETKFGSINTDYALSTKKSGSVVTTEGTIGNGENRIELKTSNGSIDIK